MALQDVIPYLDKEQQIVVPAGQVIFHAGDIGYEMYFILSGEVLISTHGQVLDHLRAGIVFGEMALVDNQVRSATATAVTDCLLTLINEACFARLTRQLPTFATDLMILMSARLRRYMEEEVQRQRLEEELAIGRQIQLSLLPESPPSIPGWEFAARYQAARQVGGDLYDFIFDPAQADLLHLVIADVTGKGVPAAMFMALCRTIIRTEALNGRSPADLLQRTNQILINERRSWPFLTAFFASLNTRTGQLTYATGGHDRPYWLQAKNGRLQQLEGRGMLLGAFPQVYLEEHTINLASGDSLVLYTDGVTEARQGETLFEEGGLEAVIRANSHAPVTSDHLAQGIFDAVVAFSGGAAQSDDITLMVVHRQ
ncbi:MAG: SpoIIE family protein phosphatase [Anaerolineales bacterium]|nr:SpoIIE family protein phosphatase [Anaerolineales bacterium]